MDVDSETGEVVVTTDVYFCEETARAVCQLFGLIVTGTIVERSDDRMRIELDETGATVIVEGTATTAAG
ncbi:MAG: hypothetical protein ACRDRM_12165 [Pseudonocardiaceae bacterium]